MIIPITEKKVIKKLHDEFIDKIYKATDKEINASLFIYHTEVKSVLQYSSKYNFWASVDPEPLEENRYWNAFGLGKPKTSTLNSIVLEINYPIKGFNPKISGFWAIDVKQMDYSLFHQGIIGGSIKGVGKSNFKKYTTLTPENINFNNLQIEAYRVLSLKDNNIGQKLHDFIYEAYKIKQKIKNPSTNFG